MAERTPRTIAESGNTGAGVGPVGPSFPEQQPWAPGQTAPAGPYPTESELPVVAVLGGPPAQLGGYSPDPNPTPQTSNVDDPLGISYNKPRTGLAQ